MKVQNLRSLVIEKLVTILNDMDYMSVTEESQEVHTMLNELLDDVQRYGDEA
jgi:hypothetical protein